MSNTIGELQRRIGDINVANGWRSRPEQQRTGADDAHAKITRLALIATEVAEAIEEVRNGHAVDETYYPENKPKPEGVPSELADIVIRALDAADAWGIDLEAMIEEKLRYNASRGHRHGGKTA